MQTLKYCFDIIDFSETWFRSNMDVRHLPGYSNISMFRENKRGDGVALYIKANLLCDIVHEFTVINDAYEAICVVTNKVAVLLLYRPPQSKVETFFEFVESSLEFAALNKCNVIIFGDLNIDLLATSNVKTNLIEIMSSYGCENVVNQSARVTKQSTTLLDVCFTSFHPENIVSGVFSLGLSDHLPSFCSVRLKKTSIKI